MRATTERGMRTVNKTSDLDSTVSNNGGMAVTVILVGFTCKDGAHSPFGVGTILFDLVLVDMDDGPHSMSLGTNTDDSTLVKARLCMSTAGA